MHDQSNAGRGKPEHSTKFRLASAGRVLGSDVSDVIFGDFGLAVLGALGGSVFARPVAHILGLSAEEKMRWPDAKRYVASMKNAHPVGDGTVGFRPRKSMSKPLLASVTDFPVSERASRAGRPQPASVAFSFGDFFPKVFDARYAASSHRASPYHVESQVQL